MKLFGMRMLASLFLAAAITSLSTSASAISLSIDGTTCGSCEGADLFLDIVDMGGSFNVTLTVSTDNLTGSKDGMVQIGFGGLHGWTQVALDSAPASSVIGWSDPVGANVSSSSLCKNGANTGKICTTGYVDVSGGGDYTWKFTVTGGTVASQPSGLHIGGQFADLRDLSRRKGPRGHLISESGTQVPEPGAALLFCAGLFAISGSARRLR